MRMKFNQSRIVYTCVNVFLFFFFFLYRLSFFYDAIFLVTRRQNWKHILPTLRCLTYSTNREMSHQHRRSDARSLTFDFVSICDNFNASRSGNSKLGNLGVCTDECRWNIRAIEKLLRCIEHVCVSVVNWKAKEKKLTKFETDRFSRAREFQIELPT